MFVTEKKFQTLVYYQFYSVISNSLLPSPNFVVLTFDYQFLFETRPTSGEYSLRMTNMKGSKKLKKKNILIDLRRKIRISFKTKKKRILKKEKKFFLEDSAFLFKHNLLFFIVNDGSRQPEDQSYFCHLRLLLMVYKIPFVL